MNRLSMILLFCVSITMSSVVQGSDTAPQTDVTKRFAEPSSSRYISGELVYIDAVNRRGGIRLDGDQGRYNAGPPHWFALLPYAPVWHNGARAELRDIPLGTHVHGYFVAPPAGEEASRLKAGIDLLHKIDGERTNPLTHMLLIDGRQDLAGDNRIVDQPRLLSNRSRHLHEELSRLTAAMCGRRDRYDNNIGQSPIVGVVLHDQCGPDLGCCS